MLKNREVRHLEVLYVFHFGEHEEEAVPAEPGREVAADITLGLIASTDRGYFRYRPRGSDYA